LIAGGLWTTGNSLSNFTQSVQELNGTTFQQAGNRGGGATPNQLGAQGEAAVRGAYDIGDKQYIDINGRVREPDGLIPDQSLSEVKNCGYLCFTQQLRDFADYASDRGLRFDLYLRPEGRLSGPLQDAINSGRINPLEIPK
jgi:hypothetical protein